MLETASDITALLNTLGEDLVFDTFVIRGLPGFDLYVLHRGESTPNVIERQNFTFQVSASDVKTHSIRKAMSFTISDGTYSYTFKTEGLFPDLYGYVAINAVLESKV